ncbi:RND superfamily putative drug exporter [Williamsia limnetica]|uniref:RND superfamily putative drug exporter n=1 Tax=Williamsia limnetica TaxID=882452 RepID=A0A318RM37_WILLI|nr:MMPL family transporter [Williamsia limnetica]PYE18139.1 RND superfamily putative drug exporter [Williamsia limnetica]
MFGAIGNFVYRLRFVVIGVMVALMAALGLYGLDLNKHLSQSGWFDPGSESVEGSQLADEVLGRDHKSDVIMLVTPPAGTKVDDPAFGAKVETVIEDLIAQHGDIVNRTDPGIIDPFKAAENDFDKATQDQVRARLFDESREHAFVSIGIKGDDDTTILNNYKIVEPFFDDLSGKYDLPGTQFQMAGLQPVAGAMSAGMDEDIKRAEIIALPLVAIMLFFIFGGVIAACLPVVIGGLTIAGSLGIMKILAQVTELNIFAQSVVTLIGLGIAIDYGLFIVSRFREELAEGYDTRSAVRRTVMTAGQTVVFSATIIVGALACLLLFPQGFLKSVAYGAIASVTLAAICSITVLPAILSILGPKIDMWGFSFLRRTKTKKEVEDGFWGKLASWVMRHPLKTAIPVVLLLLALIIPFAGIQFGGITEKYLPPQNPNRVAQQDFDTYFPTERTEEIKLVISYDPESSDDAAKLQTIADEANKIPGFTKEFTLDGAEASGDIVQMSAGLIDQNTAGEAVKELRAINTDGLNMYVAGTPALTQDSINALLDDLPLMIFLLIMVTSLLMFLAFGSVVLPIKAALVSALGLGSTLGILTWIFIDGHGSSIANFTPGPLMSAVLVLIIAIIYGLSTDYEVFLLSRMVEERQKGATTTEAIRKGTAHTGRIITAAAAILVVVTGAFGLSEIVMMKYIAYGMIAALILDATVIRMLLVPAIMKLLGDDCWWAPHWMKVIQEKIGLGETILDDELDNKRSMTATKGVRSAGTVVAEAPTSAMRTQPAAGPRAVPAGVGTARPSGPIARPDQPRPQGPAQRPATPPQRPGSPSQRPNTPESRPLPDRPAGVPVGRQDSGQTPRRPSPVGVSTGHMGSVRPDSDSGQSTGRPAPNRRPDPIRPRSQSDRPSEPPIGGSVRRAPSRPAPDSDPVAPRTPSRENARRNRPDTGGWSLGAGGIRLGGTDTPATNGSGVIRAGAGNATGSDTTSGVANGTAPGHRQDAEPPRQPGRPPRPQPTGSNRPTPGPDGRHQEPRPTGPRSVPAGRQDPSGRGPLASGSAGGELSSPLRRRPNLGPAGTGGQPLIASLNPEQMNPQQQPPRPTSPPTPEREQPPRTETPTPAPQDASSSGRRRARGASEEQISVRELLRRGNNSNNNPQE